MHARLVAGTALWLLASAPEAQQDFQLTPGTLIAQDSSGVLSGQFQIVQYSPDGVELDSFTAGFPVPFYGVMVGVTVVDGDLWTIGTGSILARIDLLTGAMTDVQFTGLASAEALAHLGSDLLIGTYGGTVQRRTTTGQVVSTFETGVPMTGLTTDGQYIYCGNYQSGVIHVFDLVGEPVTIVTTNVGGANLSGLAFDEDTGELLVSTGFGTDQVHRYSTLGGLAQSFDAGWTYLNDLEALPRGCTDAYVPQIAAGAPLVVTGHGPPSQPIALCIATSLGPDLAFNVAGFCGVSGLSPALGLVQLVTTSSASGTWEVSTPVPAGLHLPVHLQAFAAGTCPLACSSTPVTRQIQ